MTIKNFSYKKKPARGLFQARVFFCQKTQAAVPKPQIKLYEILEDIQQSAEMTESDYKVAVAISKEASEKYYGVDLSAFDILISVNCSEKIICTPVDD